jgi:hypothetical protein
MAQFDPKAFFKKEKADAQKKRLGLKNMSDGAIVEDDEKVQAEQTVMENREMWGPQWVVEDINNADLIDGATLLKNLNKVQGIKMGPMNQRNPKNVQNYENRARKYAMYGAKSSVSRRQRRLKCDERHQTGQLRLAEQFQVEEGADQQQFGPGDPEI